MQFDSTVKPNFITMLTPLTPHSFPPHPLYSSTSTFLYGQYVILHTLQMIHLLQSQPVLNHHSPHPCHYISRDLLPLAIIRSSSKPTIHHSHLPSSIVISSSKPLTGLSYSTEISAFSTTLKFQTDPSLRISHSFSAARVPSCEQPVETETSHEAVSFDATSRYCSSFC